MGWDGMGWDGVGWGGMCLDVGVGMGGDEGLRLAGCGKDRWTVVGWDGMGWTAEGGRRKAEGGRVKGERLYAATHWSNVAAPPLVRSGVAGAERHGVARIVRPGGQRNPIA